MTYNQQPPPRYVMLSEYGGGSGGESLNLRPPPHRRNLPRYYSHGRSKGGACCCGCLCWCCCFLLLFILAVVGTAAYFFFIMKPKIPSYSVSALSISSFEFRASDFTLHAKLTAHIRAENPNDMIGISYGSGSHVVVSYKNSTLCSGHLPSFYQGHRNTTVMQVVMEGRHTVDSGFQDALKENREAGQVPLDVYVRVPVSLRLDEVDLREITVNVHCALVVDSLSPNTKVNIKSAQYKVNVEF
uniref:Late embryogenesis abundant protein LEA-2 subgroup domain-containing protein n=1 Tax=Ananas comosus var. bracteatus TaxID=296719 RepID=A0A6V7Q8M2_ANACO|nr:unnamed protein product [Ananas comosus var. bracteatus]